MGHVTLLTKNNIDNYVKFGSHPGRFVELVLLDKLYDAATYADEQNKRWLADIAIYARNKVPPEARGSLENMDIWMRRKLTERMDPRD